MIIDAKLLEESPSRRSRPLTIFFEDDPIPMVDMRMHSLNLIVEVSSPFPYMDSKMVPWNYNYNYVNELAGTNILCVEA